MKKKILMVLISAALVFCIFPLYASAEADYAEGYDPGNTGNNENLVDIINQVPLAEMAPATGIDQSELATQRAFDVVIFGLGISLASVVTVAAVKKHASKSK